MTYSLHVKSSAFTQQESKFFSIKIPLSRIVHEVPYSQTWAHCHLCHDDVPGFSPLFHALNQLPFLWAAWTGILEIY
jgi:hypothetical protein